MSVSRRDDRGIATVLALGLVVVLLVATMIGVGVVRVVAARHVAAAAADLGALAGAGAVGRSPPCAAAGRTVHANDAELVSCWVSGADVIVVASARSAPLLGMSWVPRSSARAGPVR